MGMEDLKQQLINVCNESGLPLEAILYVTKDLWRDVQDTLDRVKKESANVKSEAETE